MIVIHKSVYNPRIDFIVCKQLLCNLPYEYDELKLRKCFETELGDLPYEKDIIAIKNFFKVTDITEAKKSEVETLYGICTHESVKYDGELTDVNDMDDLKRLAGTVEQYDGNNVTLFQILMLFGYCKVSKVPIMPYHGVCAKIYYSLVSGDWQRAERGWQNLLYRKNKYSIKHPIEQNVFCVSQLKEHKNEFLKITEAEELGVYGSLAREMGTEYSDVDIIVIVAQGADCKFVKEQAFKYWIDKIPVHFDVCVTSKEDMSKLPIAIRSTVKMI